MKTYLAAILAVTLVSGIAIAQRGQQSGQGRGMRSGGGRCAAQTQAQSTEELKGRDVVRLGSQGTLAGVMEESGEQGEHGEIEYVLRTRDRVYDLHFGPAHYREAQGITLANGASVTVNGFVYGDDVAVSTLQASGQTYTFRDAGGRPAWAGQARGGRGQRTGQGALEANRRGGNGQGNRQMTRGGNGQGNCQMTRSGNGQGNCQMTRGGNRQGNCQAGRRGNAHGTCSRASGSCSSGGCRR